MKALVLASILLVGFGAAAQNNAPNWFDPSSTAYAFSAKQNSNLCYAIRAFKVNPTEKVQPYSENPRWTDCTPANRFRTEYIPNPTLHREITRTGACSSVLYLGKKDGTACSSNESQPLPEQPEMRLLQRQP